MTTRNAHRNGWLARQFRGPVDTVVSLLVAVLVLVVAVAWWRCSQTVALGVTLAAALGWTWLRMLV